MGSYNDGSTALPSPWIMIHPRSPHSLFGQQSNQSLLSEGALSTASTLLCVCVTKQDYSIVRRGRLFNK